MPDRVGVFLDRDGTLNVEVDFLRSPDELQIIDGAPAAVAQLNRQGIITCVISNQSGVARGFLTEADLAVIHARLQEEFRAGGARFDRIFYCPHHPTEGIAPYNIDCECRKPKPGMLVQGANEFHLDLHRCFVVGDSVVDMQAGNAVGATTILVQTGYGKQSLQTCREQNIPVAHVAPSVVEAIDFILDLVRRRTTVS
jgi:D-glycero-D-manno-heptose 1,7-bisphosphate phosphatase